MEFNQIVELNVIYSEMKDPMDFTLISEWFQTNQVEHDQISMEVLLTMMDVSNEFVVKNMNFVDTFLNTAPKDELDKLEMKDRIRFESLQKIYNQLNE